MLADTLWPSIDQHRLAEAIGGAFAKARGNARVEKNHARRSLYWVTSLAGEFQELYRSVSDEVWVFTKGFAKDNGSIQKAFGLSELLYDVTVCRIANTSAAVAKRELAYVAEGLWAIESEFARDARAAVRDFSKLVLSSARFKLFVAPFVGPQQAFLRSLGPVANACNGTVYLCQIAHPSHWASEELSNPKLYEWHRDHWHSLS